MRLLNDEEILQSLEGLVVCCIDDYERVIAKAQQRLDLKEQKEKVMRFSLKWGVRSEIIVNKLLEALEKEFDIQSKDWQSLKQEEK